MGNYGLTPPPSPAPEALKRPLRELAEQGYTVLPEVWHSEHRKLFGEVLHANQARQEQEAGGRKALTEIGEADTVRAPLSLDRRWLYTIEHEQVAELLKHTLGDYYILHLQNGLINQPSLTHNQSQWHRDLPYQNYVSSRPLAISALWCIDEFTEENGATHVVPGSHKVEFAESEDWLEANAKVLTAPAGSVIVFDSMLMHRAGQNRSEKVRRAVNHMYSIPLIKQQIDLPRLLGEDFPDNAAQRRLLGYDSQSPRDVAAFLNRKRARQ